MIVSEIDVYMHFRRRRRYFWALIHLADFNHLALVQKLQFVHQKVSVSCLQRKTGEPYPDETESSLSVQELQHMCMCSLPFCVSV